MKTAIKRKAVAKKSVKQKEKQVRTSVPIPEGERKRIETDLIDFSPFNRRRFFNEKTLQELAADIAVHDLIHDITVRLKGDGRYELIVGERRLRAARIAKLKTVPAKIVIIADQLAKEIIFSENAHRENPHPLDEALLIADMQQEKKSTKEIALRLGKSESFVFARTKLLTLIEPFQEIFIADKMTLEQALQIATIAPESQLEFFEDNCEGWNEDDDFELDNLGYALKRYTYDLTRAPFSIKDKKLLSDVGACSNCPFNTATLKTLFPEDAKEAICTNKSCFQRKCTAHYQIQLAKLFEEKPEAIVLSTGVAEVIRKTIETIPEAENLPIYDRYNITIVPAPEEPDKDDYTDNTGEEGEPYFDEAAYNQALEEYQSDSDEYNNMIQNNILIKGLMLTPAEAGIAYFTNEKNRVTCAPKQTAKEVQEAVKSGVATPEMLQTEIERLEAKEKRAKEIDREKIQLKVHGQFKELISKLTNNRELTCADQIAARLLAYQSLDYSARKEVDATLLIANDITKEDLYDALANLSEVQVSYVIRMALASKSDGKFPTTLTAYALYKTAESAGVNVAAIEDEQKQKATERQKVCDQRINDLKDGIEEMKKDAA